MDWPWIVQQPLTTPSRQLFEGALADQGSSCPVSLVETTSIFTTLQLLEASADARRRRRVRRRHVLVEQDQLAKLLLDFSPRIEDYGALDHGAASSPRRSSSEFIDIVLDVAREELLLLASGGGPRLGRASQGWNAFFSSRGILNSA